MREGTRQCGDPAAVGYLIVAVNAAELFGRVRAELPAVGRLGSGSSPRRWCYAASKAALNILTLYQASELADYCVRVNGVCPARWSTPGQMDRALGSVLSLIEGDETGQLR
jgi:NAD(P)-dependent dehydrogenase (short-subunit alcohol dehydrogenase family)